MLNTEENTTPVVEETSILDSVGNDQIELEIVDDSMLATDENLDEEEEVQEVKPENDESEEDETEEGDDETEESLDEYSPAALQVRLLEEQGLKIYNELDKDLDFETFAKDIPAFVNETVNSRLAEAKAELGRNAEYVEMLIQNGIPKETLMPAMAAEHVANFDIAGSDVTEEALVDIVFKTELRKGRDSDEAQFVADAVKAKGLEFLKDRATKDIAWTDGYIKDIKTRAKAEHQASVASDTMQQKVAHDEFVGKLQESVKDKDAVQAIYNFNYKRDVLVRYTENGEEKQSYVTPYEMAIHEIQQDSSKQVALMQFLMSGLNADKLAGGKARGQVSSQILNALNKQTEGVIRGGKKTKPTNKSNRNNYQQVADEPIEVIGEI